MDCREFEEHIPAWLDGMMEAGVLEAMNLHRSECVECARTLKIHEYIFNTLEITDPVASPSGLTEKILAAAALEESAVTVTPLHRRLLMVVSTAAFVLLGGGIAGVAGFLLRSQRLLGISDNLSANWTYLVEWPLLVKAWFLGLLTRQWMQTLVSPIHISSLGLNVPVFVIAAYVMLLGVLFLIAWRYFNSPIGSGIAVTVRNAHSRY